MIRSRHTGINVRSLGEALKFYHDLLGLEIAEVRTEQRGEYIDTLTGIKGTFQHWAKVKTEDGYLLELVQWVQPKPQATKGPMYDWQGINHLCFQVDSVDQIWHKLLHADCHCGQIQTDPPGKVRNFSCRDPDGNILEFVEVLEKPPQITTRGGGRQVGL